MVSSQGRQWPQELAPGGLREHLSSPVTRAVVMVQLEALKTVRDFLGQDGFIEMLGPVLGPVTDPGCGWEKQVSVDYYGQRYKLMSSVIFYKQAALLAFNKVFFVASNVRAEPAARASTGRHLAEFHQIDVEVRSGSRDEVMQTAERLVTRVIEDVVEHCGAELVVLGRTDKDLLKLIARPFDVISHREAMSRLDKLGYPGSSKASIDWEGERILSSTYSQPFFIVDYPKGGRAFLNRISDADPNILDNFDLIAADGSGELASGGSRETDYDRVIARMIETGEDPENYGWYLDMIRVGLPGSAGFGIGLERLVRYLSGVSAVWQATAFPKLPGYLSP